MGTDENERRILSSTRFVIPHCCSTPMVFVICIFSFSLVFVHSLFVCLFVCFGFFFFLGGGGFFSFLFLKLDRK